MALHPAQVFWGWVKPAIHKTCLGGMAAVTLWATASSAEIESARYTDPTARYDHGILGDAIEYGALELGLVDGKRLTLRLPKDRVFEDLAPRLVDVDLDGEPEVVVIETSLQKGARLAIYDETGLIAATPFIGRTHRWLAPIGAADLDGDGRVEFAYIDRPHLAKTLRIWRLVDGELVHVLDQKGLTNHKIGQGFISGGLRECGAGPEMVTADASWSNIVATRFKNGRIEMRVVSPFKGAASFAKAMDCAAR